jgi:hypothetical protein
MYVLTVTIGSPPLPMTVGGVLSSLSISHARAGGEIQGLLRMFSVGLGLEARKEGGGEGERVLQEGFNF